MLKLLLQLLEMVLNRAPLINGEKNTPLSAKDADGEQVQSSGIIKYKNDSERLRIEHEALEKANNDLYFLLDDLSRFLWAEFEQELVITMINRTQDEQDEIYAGTVRSDGRSYDDRPWTSPHQYNHAADIRSRDFTEEQIQQIEDYLNAKYNQHNYYRWTAKNHTVGHGWHFHIQFVKED